MIQLPTKTSLETLRAHESPLCLTIYSPYVQPTPFGNPNRTQLNNLLKNSRQLLRKWLFDKEKIDEFLQPIKNLLDGNEFRQYYKHGLALFIAPGFFEYLHIPPTGIEQMIAIDNHFIVQPIINIEKNKSPYFILTLSQNGAQLLKGDRYDIRPVQKFAAMKNELNIDEFPKERQAHKVGSMGFGKISEKFHGQYNRVEVNKKLLKKFFKRIDGNLRKIIDKEKLPLIIAGVDYLLPIYRQINTYPHLLINEIKGSLERASLDLIRKRASRVLVHSKI